MRVQIEIPKEFEEDYRKDRFRDFFERVRADIDCRGLCGNYEKETKRGDLTVDILIE